MAWRKILLQWKRGPGMKEPTVPKSVFPRLLSKLLVEIQPNREQNIKSGFRKAGIVPLDRTQVLNMLPQDPTDPRAVEDDINNSFVNILREMRYGDQQPKKKNTKKKVNVQAGKSVTIDEKSAGPKNLEESENTSSSEDLDIDSDVENQSNICNTPVDKKNTLKNVYPVKVKEIKENDWLLVGFAPETRKAGSSTNLKYFICQVVKQNNNEFLGNFLREKNTRDHLGFIFQYPEKQELTEFSFKQIVGRLKPPKNYLRGYLKFNVNFADLIF